MRTKEDWAGNTDEYMNELVEHWHKVLKEASMRPPTRLPVVTAQIHS